MTLQELTGFTADQLEAITDSQLLEICKSWFPVTRPEMIIKQPKKPEVQQVYLSPQKQKALALLAEEGLDVGFLRRKRK